MRYLLLYLLINLIPVHALFAKEITFSATAPSTVIEGSRFQLVYSINAEATNLRMPDVPDFQILMGPSTSQSTSVQIINNQVTREISYSFTYILRADKTGTFTIPPAMIDVNGRTLSSNGLTIEVIPGDDPAAANQAQQPPPGEVGAISREDLYITMTANKTEVWQDEPILVTTRIYTRVNLESISDVRRPNLQNFVVNELEASAGPIEWSIQNIGGRTYNVAVFNQKLIYPQSPGRHVIEPMSIEFVVRQRQARQSRSIFEDFFETTRSVRHRVNSQGLTINVKPLPAPRPSEFSGVVGNITMQVTASSTEANVNDGITLRTEISGVGNHHLARNPRLNIPPDFESFEPKITTNITHTPQGGRGSRILETLIIPRHPGTFVIPAVEYNFFNPATGRFQALISQPITITVTGTAGNQLAGTGITASALNREAVQLLGRDIRFINTGNITLRPANVFLFGTPLFAVAYIAPLALFLSLVVIYKRRIKDNADILRVKNRKANRLALRRLKKASAFLRSGNQERFYEELSRALWGYASDKLSIPVAQLNKDNARNILSINGVDESLSESFLGIIETCEYARYAPLNDHQERDTLYRRALETIDNLEDQIGRQTNRNNVNLQLTLKG